MRPPEEESLFSATSWREELGPTLKHFFLLIPKMTVSRANNHGNTFKKTPEMLLEAVENLAMVGFRRENHPTKAHFMKKPSDDLGRSPCTLNTCCESHCGGMLSGAIPQSVKYVADDPGQISKNIA